MTAPLLLALIASVLILQFCIGIGIAILRKRRASAPVVVPDVEAVSLRTWTGWRKFRVVRREFEDPDRTQCSFYLEPVDRSPLSSFRPGQYLTFRLGPLTRCYSLSDSPDPTSYRITVKRVPAPFDRPSLPPGACSGHLLDRVKVGDVLEMKAPSGRFFLDPDPTTPAVLIGGGVGITPMMSMLRWCLSETPQRIVHLYYGVRNSGEHAFKQQLEQLARTHRTLQLNVVYSRPGPNDALGRDFRQTGHVDITLLQRTLPEGRYQFYVCGPAKMMESLLPALVDWGVAKDNIHHEAFGPASAPKKDVPSLRAPVEIHFRRSGRTLLWDGQDETLLEFAERHAVPVDAGCRSGGCGCCETKLVSGTVRYVRDPDHELTPGSCLLCLATPASALTLEA
ncbi:MAG: 2Fe-2S iron-sulfur cluster-binding protein [Myxococcales bacterium]